jgi:hypothetical protein
MVYTFSRNLAIHYDSFVHVLPARANRHMINFYIPISCPKLTACSLLWGFSPLLLHYIIMSPQRMLHEGYAALPEKLKFPIEYVHVNHASSGSLPPTLTQC